MARLPVNSLNKNTLSNNIGGCLYGSLFYLKNFITFTLSVIIPECDHFLYLLSPWLLPLLSLPVAEKRPNRRSLMIRQYLYRASPIRGVIKVSI
jgi:hypothetical protein